MDHAAGPRVNPRCPVAVCAPLWRPRRAGAPLPPRPGSICETEQHDQQRGLGLSASTTSIVTASIVTVSIVTTSTGTVNEIGTLPFAAGGAHTGAAAPGSGDAGNAINRCILFGSGGDTGAADG